MKKILSLLASLGIAATASSAVVACTNNDQITEKKVEPKKAVDKELLNKIKEQEEKVERVSTQVNIFTKEVEAINKEIIPIVEQITNEKDSKNTLENMIEQTGRVVKAAEYKIEQLSERKEEATRINNKAINDREKWANKSINDAREIIRRNVKRIKEFDKVPKSFNDELAVAENLLPVRKSELEKSKSDLEAAEKKFGELTDLLNLINESGQNEDEANIIKNMIKTRKEVKVLSEKIYSLQDEIDKLNELISHHISVKGIQEAINSQKENNKSIITKLDQEIRRAKKAIHDVQFNKNEYDELINESGREKDALEQQISSITESLLVNKDNLSQEQKDLEIQHKKVIEIEDKYNKLSNELKEKEDKLNKLKEELDITKAIKLDLEDKLNKK